jgi:Mur ligase family, catalytic domain
VATTSLKSPDAAARWLRSWVTGTLRSDSRQVKPGDAFIAWPGYANDGRRFVKAALAAGATTCLVEREGLEAFAFDDARIASLPGLKASPPPAPTARPRPPGGPRRHSRCSTSAAPSSALWASACRRCPIVRRRSSSPD